MKKLLFLNSRMILSFQSILTAYMRVALNVHCFVEMMKETNGVF